MTYNLDPDRWLADHTRALEAERYRGELTDAAFREALADLERRYDALVARLDGTYVLPAER